MGDWIKQCNVHLWKYHEPLLSFVLIFNSLSKYETTNEYVCTLVRELQVNQSHWKLKWVQPFMSNFTVVSFPYLYTEILGRTSMHCDSCKCLIHLALYTSMDDCAHPETLWSQSNKSLLSVANLMCMYWSIFQWIYILSLDYGMHSMLWSF